MDDLSPAARAALRSYHADAALDPDARARVWRRVDADLAADVTPLRPPRRRLAALAVITGLAAALLFAVCDVRGLLTGARRDDADAAVYGAAPTRPLPARSRPAPASPPLARGPAPPPSSTPTPPTQRPAAPPSTLAAEVASLRAARSALDAGDPAGALRALERHAREFADGQMLEDRLRLRIEALCALGRAAEARREADAFLADHPRSTHAARVAALCRDP